jgi:hypothetical protein
MIYFYTAFFVKWKALTEPAFLYPFSRLICNTALLVIPSVIGFSVVLCVLLESLPYGTPIPTIFVRGK